MRSAVLLVVGLAASGPAAAQTAADHVTMGVTASQARDPRTAMLHFDAALVADSMGYQANWRGALTLIDLGKQIPDSVKSPERDSLYARAEVLARRAVLADSTKADGHFALANAIGRASLTQGTEDRVRRAAEIRSEAMTAIELDPSHDGAYHILGRWNAEIMRLSGISRFFAKNFLGAAIFNQASWDNAVSNLEKAVELDPNRIYHHLDLAEIYVDRKRYGDARTQLEQVEALPISDVMDSTYKQQAAALLAKIADERDKS